MKKNYIIPELIVIEAETGNLLEGSPVKEGGNNKNDDEITDGSDIGAKPHHGYIWDWEESLDDEKE